VLSPPHTVRSVVKVPRRGYSVDSKGVDASLKVTTVRMQFASFSRLMAVGATFRRFVTSSRGVRAGPFSLRSLLLIDPVQDQGRGLLFTMLNLTLFLPRLASLEYASRAVAFFPPPLPA